MITQARLARESCEKVRSNAGKATFTIERSSEAMKAPSAVTKKITRLRDEWSAASTVLCRRSAAGPLQTVRGLRHETERNGLRSMMQPTIVGTWNARASPPWTARSPSVSRWSASGGAC